MAQLNQTFGPEPQQAGQNERYQQDQDHFLGYTLQPGEIVKIRFFDVAIHLGKQLEGSCRKHGRQQNSGPDSGENNAHNAPNYNKGAAAFACGGYN